MKWSDLANKTLENDVYWGLSGFSSIDRESSREGVDQNLIPVPR